MTTADLAHINRAVTYAPTRAAIDAALSAKYPGKPVRAKRGTVKAEMLRRTIRAAELLGLDRLPDNIRARGGDGGPNGWESKFAGQLLIQKRAGIVADYAFQPLRLTLAPGVTYCPDFIIRYADGRIRAVEIKGRRRRVAAYKLAVAAFPRWEWSIMELTNAGWRPKRVYGLAENSERPQKSAENRNGC